MIILFNYFIQVVRELIDADEPGPSQQICDYTSGPEVTPAREDDVEVQTESESVEIGVQASVNTRNVYTQVTPTSSSKGDKIPAL